MMQHYPKSHKYSIVRWFVFPVLIGFLILFPSCKESRTDNSDIHQKNVLITVKDSMFDNLQENDPFFQAPMVYTDEKGEYSVTPDHWKVNDGCMECCYSVDENIDTLYMYEDIFFPEYIVTEETTQILNEEGAGFDVNVEPEKGTDGKYRVSIVFYSDTFTYPYDTILLFDNVRYAPQREMGIYRDLGEPSISYSNEFSVYGENPDEVNEKLNESYISYGQYISFIKTNVSFSSQDVRIGFLK